MTFVVGAVEQSAVNQSSDNTASLKQWQAANGHAVTHSQQPAFVFTNFVCDILLKC